MKWTYESSNTSK